jgi:sec-independent protein translocase protein TatB
VFGIGFMELLVIAVVALVFVGPKKLPDLMRQAGRFFVQMRRTTSDVRSTFDQVVRDAEDEIRREHADALKHAILPPDQEQAADHTTPEGDDLHNPDGTLKSLTDPDAPDGAKSLTPQDSNTDASFEAHTEPTPSEGSKKDS